MAAKKPTTVAPAKQAGASAWTEGVDPWVDRALDDGFAEIVRRARQGDLGAAKRLHGIFAKGLLDGTLREVEKQTLIQMHEELARGEDAERATLMAPPANRRIMADRDDQLFLFVYAGVVASKMEGGKKPNLNALYAKAAKAFGIGRGTAKGIYLKVRKAMDED